MLVQYSAPLGLFLPGTTPPPSFTPAAGTYGSAQSIMLTDQPGALIYYTTDGSIPTVPISGTTQLYTGPFTVGTTVTVNAIAVLSGFQVSAVSTAVYTITQPAATPTFSPAAGTYTSAQSVAINCTTPNATIYYTVNGGTPTITSPVYTAPIPISATSTIQAMATALPGFTQSAVAIAQYTINAITVPALQVKFVPGDYAAGTIQNYYGTTVASAQSDINRILTAGTANCVGYVVTQTWARNLEFGSANSLTPQYQFIGLDNILAAIWALWPQANIGLFVMGNNYGALPSQANMTSANYGQAAGFYIPTYITNCGGTLTVPNSFGSGSSTQYAVAPDFPGGPNYGADIGAFNSPNTPMQFSPQWHNQGIMQCFINMLQALSQYVLTQGPFKGMTLDQCPQFQFIHINDELSNFWTSANNYTGNPGLGINPPANANGTPPVVSSAATVAQFYSQHVRLYQAMTSFFPHTLVGSCESFGVAYGNNSDTGANVAANINQNLPAANRSASIALSTIRGVALDCADTYAYDFNMNPGGWRMQNGPAGFIGIVNGGASATNNNNTWVAPTFPSIANKMPHFGQVQPNDYFVGVSGAGNNASAVQQVSAIMNNGYFNMSHALWWMTDDENVPPGNNFLGDAAWGSYIYPTLSTAGIAGVRAAVQLPTSLMYGPTITSAILNSATSATINWQSIPTSPSAVGYQGQGLFMFVYRNGTTEITGGAISASAGTFTDAGYTSGTTYTLAMHNANGTGPQGPSATPGVLNPTAFTWTPSTSAGVTGYNVGVRLSTGTPGVYPASSTYAVAGQSTSSMLLSTIVPPLAHGTYFWAVQSVGPGNAVSAFTAEQEFILA